MAASLTHSTKRAASHSDHPLEDGPTNVVVMRLLGAPNPQRRDCTRRLSSILVTLCKKYLLVTAIGVTFYMRFYDGSKTVPESPKNLIPPLRTRTPTLAVRARLGKHPQISDRLLAH